MIVVSDTTPLNYLILIEADAVLPRLFGRVHVPPAVLAEMRHPRAPEPVRRWAASPPAWVVVRAPERAETALLRIHAGEIQAIALAEEITTGSRTSRCGAKGARRGSSRTTGAAGPTC